MGAPCLHLLPYHFHRKVGVRSSISGSLPFEASGRLFATAAESASTFWPERSQWRRLVADL
eukprot:8496798-Pyramimonas_sp.AAC.1